MSVIGKTNGGKSTELYKSVVSASALLAVTTTDESEWVRLAGVVAVAAIVIAYSLGRSAVKKGK